MGYLLSCGCVNTIVPMHHIDANEIPSDIVILELHENDNYCFFTNPGRNTSSNRISMASLSLHQIPRINMIDNI